MITAAARIRILISVLVANVLSDQNSKALTSALASQPDAVAIAQTFDDSRLIRKLRLADSDQASCISLEVYCDKDKVIYQDQVIGNIQILFKSPLPGELQARLAIESAIDRFLEYLQKLYQIVVLDESNHHVHVFIPVNKASEDFKTHWERFLIDVAFSANGNLKFKLPGLVQTFIVMLNAITLSGRGFSTLDVPILTQEQSNVLAAWYFAVFRDVKNRQKRRGAQIAAIQNLADEARKPKEKELKDKEAMQAKEQKKYTEYFKKGFRKILEEQNSLLQELNAIEIKLTKPGLSKAQQRQLQNQQEKLREKVIFSQESVQDKLNLLEQCGGNPFEFVQLDQKQNPARFKVIDSLANNFSRTATDQINSTRGDIFTQCISEMYCLLENKPSEALPKPLLSKQAVVPAMRSPGDDSKEFCYSCGVALDPKTARWQVLRFMFERPSQRRQSSSTEGRPHICASCSALAFASPLKLTDESIILQLKPIAGDMANELKVDELKVKDYIRMLTNKELHLSAGRYVVLTSEHIGKGEEKTYASDKFGQLQYALLKVAYIFPAEVFDDFNFYLITQSSQSIILENRQLIFIKGLMDSYSQSIINYPEYKSDDKNQKKEAQINMKLGDAVRYVQQDLPFLADYTLAKTSSFSKQPELEQTRADYYRAINKEIGDEGMTLEKQDQLPRRAKLYKDVAALTGLTYPFAESLERTVEAFLKEETKKDTEKVEKIKEKVEREVSKLIENVDDPTYFCYYASLGEAKKTNVWARLKLGRDNHFIYEQVKDLLERELKILGREESKDNQTWLNLYADDIAKAYSHFAADPAYVDDKGWKELTYQLKLSLYTRFPELVRKLKSTTES